MGSDDSYPKKHIVLYPTWHDRSHYDQTTKRILSGWLLAKEHSSCGRVRLLAGNEIEAESEDSVDGEQQHPLEPVRLTVAHDLAADAHGQDYGQ